MLGRRNLRVIKSCDCFAPLLLGRAERTGKTRSRRVTSTVLSPQVLQHQLCQKSLPPCLWNQNRSRTRRRALRRTWLPQGTRSRGRRSPRARRQRSRAALDSTGGAGASPGLPSIGEGTCPTLPHGGFSPLSVSLDAAVFCQ